MGIDKKSSIYADKLRNLTQIENELINSIQNFNYKQTNIKF